MAGVGGDPRPKGGPAMSNLPKWVKKQGTLDHYENVDVPLLFQALAIAWEALEDVERGIFCTDVMSPRNCLHCRTKKAMGRIAELGGRKHSSTNQFTGICPHCGKAHTNPLKCECLLCVTWRKAAKK